jgi:hypothetical protein
LLPLCHRPVGRYLRLTEGDWLMRKLIQTALVRHLREQGEPTGALLIIFRDGQPQITGLIDEADETAEVIITAIMSAISEPDAADENEDTIGPCAGQA